MQVKRDPGISNFHFIVKDKYKNWSSLTIKYKWKAYSLSETSNLTALTNLSA